MPININAIKSMVTDKIGDGSSLVDGSAIAAQAQQELVSCMNTAIASSLFGNEPNAVGSASPGGISNLGNGCYEIGVSIGAQYRPSLIVEYNGDGVDDMAALFNNGYAAGRKVYKFDDNGYVVASSRQYRLPAQFVQTGLSMFQVSGGGNYQVVSVQPNYDRFI